MKRIIFIATQDLNFFYRLNKELLRLKVKFEILSGRSKIPSVSSIILTTSEEIYQFKNQHEKLQILPYHKDENFDHYILKILAANKLGYKDKYSVLLFSVDPGTKKIGTVIFLDDYYLQSHTTYNKGEFMKLIKDYLTCFQSNASNPLRLIFKFGKGVISLTFDLLMAVFDTFQNRENIKVYLIDESLTSKIRIQDIKKQVKTKHEVSALIIAMRKGIEVDSNNYLQVIKQNSFQKNAYHERGEDDWDEIQEKKLNLIKIIKRLITNDISLKKSFELIKSFNIKPKRYYKRNPIKKFQF